MLKVKRRGAGGILENAGDDSGQEADRRQAHVLSPCADRRQAALPEGLILRRGAVGAGASQKTGRGRNDYVGSCAQE